MEFKEEEIDIKRKEGIDDFHDMDEQDTNEEASLKDITTEALREFKLIIPDLSSKMYLQDNNSVSHSLRVIRNFLSFRENTRAGDLIINSGIFSLFLNIYRENFIRDWYLVLRSMVKCEENVKIGMIKNGLLHLFLNNGDLTNPQTNCKAMYIICKMCETSHLASLLIYSSPILEVMMEGFNETKDSDIGRYILLIIDSINRNNTCRRVGSDEVVELVSKEEYDQFFEGFELAMIFDQSLMEATAQFGFMIDPSFGAKPILEYINVLKDIDVDIVFAQTCSMISSLLFRRAISIHSVEDLRILDALDSCDISDLSDTKKTHLISLLAVILDASELGEISEYEIKRIFNFFLQVLDFEDTGNLNNVIASLISLIKSSPKNCSKIISGKRLNLIKEILKEGIYFQRKEALYLFLTICEFYQPNLITHSSIELLLLFIDPDTNDLEPIKFMLSTFQRMVIKQEHKMHLEDGSPSLYKVLSETSALDQILELLDHPDEDFAEFCDFVYESIINDTMLEDNDLEDEDY